LSEFFGERLARLGLLAVDDEAELVAGEPGHHTATGAGLDTAGNLDQELVAHRVAEHIVDFLQAIEVDA
jgi:hypothetical protein